MAGLEGPRERARRVKAYEMFISLAPWEIR